MTVDNVVEKEPRRVGPARGTYEETAQALNRARGVLREAADSRPEMTEEAHDLLARARESLSHRGWGYTLDTNQDQSET